MRAVIYTRVSQDRKSRQKSVSQQEDEARLACAALGWEVVEVFTDNDRSASRHATKERPGYAELRRHLTTEPVGVLVLWESSRGSRELEDWAGLLNLCRTRGIFIHIVDHDRTYNLDIPRDWKTLAEDGVSNAYASEETRQRVLRDVRATAAKGLPHGKLQYGYARHYGPDGSFIEQYAVPEQAAVLREAARRLLAGESCYAVAVDFNRRGIAAPGVAGVMRRAAKVRASAHDGGAEADALERKAAALTWDGPEIKRLVINPAYIGKRVHQGVIVSDAVWPAILDEEDHYRLVQLLTDPARRTVENPAVTHLLTGLARAQCGGPMRPQKNRTIRSYMCRADFCVSIKVQWLEGFVSDLVIARLSMPDAAEVFAARTDDTKARAAAEAEAKTLQDRLDAFTLEGARGNLTPARLAIIEAELTPQIEAARLRARPRPVSAAVAELTAPGVDVAARWAKMSIVRRRDVVNRVIGELRVAKGRQGARSFDPVRLDNSRWMGDTMTWGERRATLRSAA